MAKEEKKPTEKLTEDQKKEQLQQKYMQFQVLQQQIEQTSQQLEAANQQFAELEMSLEALKKIEKTPKDNEILANLAPGIFFKTSLKENQKMIVNVGSNTAVEKTIPQVTKMLESQKENLQKNLTQLEAVLQIISQQAMGIYQELEG